jgi:glutamate-1-semialdehyde 2,1-aminomutase
VSIAVGNLSIEAALVSAHERYVKRHPQSAAAYEAARAVMPGGNTRSVLYFDPFPLTMQRGEGAEVWDIDGHRYYDFVGEFSAGLYGHSDPVIRSAIIDALDRGIVMAAPTTMEERLASAITKRFPSIEQLRFCNSGTEANLLAIVTALNFTGRRRIMVFREAYHGGVLTFAGGGSPVNVPFEFVLADYNDPSAAEQLISDHADSLAAVIVEPILGAAGNIPGNSDFLRTLRRATQKTGALLIFDEVKTSRCGAGGMQKLHGIAPDLTTIGKYIGGGLPTGVFGGRADIMSCFDPKSAKALRHAGTFNNNVCSMAAGYAGLTQVFTAARAEGFLQEQEVFRLEMNEKMMALNMPMQFIGLGSMFTVHFSTRPITSPKEIPAVSRRFAQLFHVECILNNVLVASRGDVFMSLPMGERHKAALSEAVSRFTDSYGELIRREIASLT